MAETEGVVARSLKLNRDLDRMLEQALELDRQVKIGWGRDGDERPKSGETGVLRHLPEGGRIRLLGNLGDGVGLANGGAVVSLEGSVGRMCGAFQSAGRILIEKHAGDRLGRHMSGGRIVVRGDAGEATGSMMSDGLIVVRGAVGRRCGSGMSGGTVVVLAGCGAECGYGMQGGRVVVDGRAPPPGEGAIQRAIDATEVEELNQSLEEHGLKVSSDAIVVENDGAIPISWRDVPVDSRGDLNGIRLVPSGDRNSRSTPVDLLRLLARPGAEDGIVLHAPWLPCHERGPTSGGPRIDRQPCIVESKPRPIDLLKIGRANLHEAIDAISGSGGAVIDLASLPAMDDAEIDAIRIAYQSRLDDDAPIFLADRIDRSERTLRVAKELGLSGVVMDARSPGSPHVSTALPTIGLASRRVEIDASRFSIILELPWSPTSADALIACAAGCAAVAGDPFANDGETPSTIKKRAQAIDSMLEEVEAEMRGWLSEIGVDSIERLDRRNLRAVDHHTASITGLRMDGLDRPLPHWLAK